MKRKLRMIIGTLLLSFSVAVLAAPVSPGGLGDPISSSQAFAERARLVADSIVSSMIDEHRIPGLTLAIVKDDEVVVLKGYGYANLEKHEPVDPGRHLFRIGSTSKTFTWTAVMQLVEQGKLDLNENVNTYLKHFKIPDTFDAPVTINDLMAHRGGFEDWGVGMFVADPDDLMPLQDFLRVYMPERVRKPGEAVAYSNYGTALAGLIVQEVSGQRFDQYVKEHIFDPLGMGNTTFLEPFGPDKSGLKMVPELAQNAALSYADGDGVRQNYPTRFASSGAPAGSAYSTAADMANYLIAYLNNGELNGQRILREDTVRQMRKRNFDNRRAMDDFAHGFFNGSTSGYEYFGHGGATATFRTVMDYYPELGFGVYATINQAGGTETIGKLPALLVDRLFRAKEVTARPEASKDFVQQAEKYSGYYETNRRAFTNLERSHGLFSPDTSVTVDAEGHLLITRSGKTEPWVEIAPLTFQQRYGDETITFEADAEGKILRFNTHLGHNSYEKTGYFSTRGFFNLAVILTLLFSGTTLLGGWRRRALTAAEPKTFASRAAFFAACGAVVWVVSLVAGIIQWSAVIDWFPQPLVVLFTWVSLLVAVIFLILAASVPGAWTAGGWPLMRKIHHTIYAVCGLLMIIAMWQWNLMAVIG